MNQQHWTPIDILGSPPHRSKPRALAYHPARSRPRTCGSVSSASSRPSLAVRSKALHLYPTLQSLRLDASMPPFGVALRFSAPNPFRSTFRTRPHEQSTHRRPTERKRPFRRHLSSARASLPSGELLPTRVGQPDELHRGDSEGVRPRDSALFKYYA
jgi:hypothetical protein